MYCAKCGTQNDDDSKFCIKCGIDIQGDTGSVNKDIESPKRLGNIGLKSRKTLKIIIAIIGLIIVMGAIVILLAKLDKQGDDNQDISGDESDVNNNDLAEPILVREGQYNQTLDSTKDLIKISISSTPPNANIYIDGIFKGNTPSDINLPEGNYSLKMNITGYKSIGTKFNITSDMERQEISVALEPIDAPYN